MKNSTPTYDVLKKRNTELLKEIDQLRFKITELEKSESKTKRAEEAHEKDTVAHGLPQDDALSLNFEDIFNLNEIQRLQDEFAIATGVASIITNKDGIPITKPSNFCSLCTDIIRKTDIGRVKCFKSDAEIGRFNPEGPIIQQCMSAGLWDAGASISVGGKHIANWLIGQVRDETQTEEKIREYAIEIGANVEAVIEAFHKVPFMSHEKFGNVARVLFTLANQLSTSAYQNVQQVRTINEQKLTEEALRKSEDKFKSIFDFSADALHLMDGAKFLDSNEKAIKMYGYKTKEEMLNATPMDISPDKQPDGQLSGEKAMKYIQGALAGNPQVFYWQHKRHDNGELFDVEVMLNSIVLGNKTYLLAAGRDITERKKVEEQIRFLSSIVEQSADGMAISDFEGNLLFVNNSWAGMHGYEKANELLGKNLRIFHNIEQINNDVEPFNRKVMEKGHHTGEVGHIRRDGTIFPTQMTTTMIRDENNNPIAIAGVAMDITLRKLTEEMLRESEEKFRILSDQAMMGIIILQDELFKYVNDRAAEIMDVPVEEIVNWSPRDYAKLIHPDDLDFVMEQGRKKQTGEKDAVIHYNWRMVTPGGDLKWIEMLSKTITFANQTADMVTMIDITERKQAEERIKQQLDELKRWYSVTLGREDRIRELKREVNEILDRLGEPFRYSKQETGFANEKSDINELINKKL